MKKLFVLIFFILCAFGEWQQSNIIALPKTLQVNDLTIDNTGAIWILSASSVLKLDEKTKSPVLIEELPGGRAITAQDKIYIMDNLNHLMILDPIRDEFNSTSDLVFGHVRQLAAIDVNNEEFIIALEPNQLSFNSPEKVLGTIITSVDRFSVIPLANYNDPQTSFFTLNNNRIYSWTGGTLKNTGNYVNRLLYSATNTIFDFSADDNGNLYILFSDSIVVLGSEGNYKSKISIDNFTVGSRILVNSANGKLILYQPFDKTLKILSSVRVDERSDIILNKNVPNPVDNFTQIEFTINQPLHLAITLYNLIGRPVRVIAKGSYNKGSHQVTWNGEDEKGVLVPNGVYFYRLESEKGVAIRQLIVLR